MRRLAVAALLGVAVLVTATAASGAARTLIPGCGGSDHARYKPANIIVACGDGAFRVADLRWATWGGSRAAGHGTGKVNNCRPNCAGGRFEDFPVKLVASRPRTCRNGKREFARVDYTFTHKRPRGVRRSGSLTRSCTS